MIKIYAFLFTRAALLFMLASPVHAAIVTHGALSTDDSTNIITDSLNNYEWLRLDVLPLLTHAQTVAILGTQDGGGWNIAGNVQANQFVDALFAPSTHACPVQNACGTLGAWQDGDFGDNRNMFADQAFFDDGAGYAGYVTLGAIMQLTPNAMTIAQSDTWTDVTWLLYRNSQVLSLVVPVPPSIILFGSGLLGLIGLARRKVCL